MNILESIKQEKEERIDPFLLFDELSKLTKEPVELIVTAFIRLYEPMPFDPKESYKFYRYDSVRGMLEIVYDDDLMGINRHLDFLNEIARGAERHIIVNDDYSGWWGISWGKGIIDIDKFGNTISYEPFYFKRSEIEDFLIIHKMPLPPCIINSNETENKKIDDYLKRFLSRPTIQIKEAANIIAGLDPHDGGFSRDAESNYYSMWEAIDKRLLTASNITWAELEDKHGGTRRDNATLVTNEVANWARVNGYNWPLPINDDIEESTQNNNELQEQINQLKQELDKQKKINDDFVVIPLYKDNEEFLKAYKQGKHHPNTMTDIDFTEEYNQLKIDNQKLTEQLNDANKKIEELEKQVPILLGQYKTDDLLLLAIQSRYKYWSNYTDTDPNYKSLSAEQIRRSIKKEFNHLSDRELKAIEFVSCPINRKK